MKKAMIALVMLVCMAFTADAMYYQLQYRGTIGSNEVEVALGYNTGDAATGGKPYWISGSRYRYTKVGNGESITLKELSKASSKTWQFDEYSGGKLTGHWFVKQTNNGLEGTFRSAKTGKKYRIKLYNVQEEEWEW